MILLLSCLIAFAFAQTEIVPGSALVMSLKGGDVDICPVKVVVPESRAGAKCVLEMRAILTGTSAAGGVDLAFYWKKDSFAFTDADKLAPLADTNIENKAPCATAGTYYIGLKTTKCTVCSDTLNIQASFDLDVAFRIDGTYQIDFDGTVNRQSAWLLSKANDYVYVNFGIKDKGTPHFNINKCDVKCLADNYDYYYGKQGIDFTTNSTDRIAVSGDMNNVVKLAMIEPGNYTFAVFIKSVVGTTTQFRFQYSLNELVNTPYPNGVCPSAKCSTVLNCPECANNKCNWCEATRTCSNGGCSGNDTAVTAADKCLKISDVCTGIKNCGDCADRLGCIWCNSLAGVGIQASGSCSAGKFDNGVDCISPTATAITDRAKCPGGGSSSAGAATQTLSALLALLVLALSF